MNLFFLGESERKSEIIIKFQNNGFKVNKVDALESLIENLVKSSKNGFVLLNPDQNLLFTISQLDDLREKIGVCIFDKEDEITISDLSIVNEIDMFIYGIPTEAKLNKLKKLFGNSICSNDKVAKFYDFKKESCILESFLNYISSGFVSFNKEGEVVIVNNVFRQITKSFGKVCNVGDSYCDCKDTMPELYKLLSNYFEKKPSRDRISENIQFENGQELIININPFFDKQQMIALVLYAERNSSSEIDRFDLNKYDNKLNNVLKETLKSFDMATIGTQIIRAASVLTNIKRVFLSFNFEGENVRNIFSGFFKWEKDKLKKFSYDYNLQKIIFNKNHLIADEVYLLPQSSLFDLADLCLLDEDNGNFFTPLFIPIKGRNEELFGIIRFDIKESQKPNVKGFRLFQEFISHVALKIESVRIEKQAEVSAKFMKKVINNINDVVLVLDKNWKILSANTAIKNIIGMEREDVIGREFESIFQSEVLLKLKEKIKNEDTLSLEFQLEKNDRTIYLSISPSSFLNHERKKRIVLLISDITNIKELKNKDVELGKLDAISKAAIAANDKINTPLTIILAHLGILKYKGKEGISFEDLNNSVEVIDKQVKKISKIMDKLRDIQKIKTKKYAQRDLYMLDLDSVDSVDSSDF